MKRKKKFCFCKGEGFRDQGNSLGVVTKNLKAYESYNRIGFKDRKHHLLTKIL